jgi:hypothetical protein
VAVSHKPFVYSASSATPSPHRGVPTRQSPAPPTQDIVGRDISTFQRLLFETPRRALVPSPHCVGPPGSALFGMARSAGVRNLVLVCHRGGYKPERVRMNEGAWRSFRFDGGHVTGYALAPCTTLFVMRMLFDCGGTRPIRRRGTVAIHAELVGGLS